MIARYTGESMCECANNLDHFPTAWTTHQRRSRCDGGRWFGDKLEQPVRHDFGNRPTNSRTPGMGMEHFYFILNDVNFLTLALLRWPRARGAESSVVGWTLSINMCAVFSPSSSSHCCWPDRKWMYGSCQGGRNYHSERDKFVTACVGRGILFSVGILLNCFISVM